MLRAMRTMVDRAMLTQLKRYADASDTTTAYRRHARVGVYMGERVGCVSKPICLLKRGAPASVYSERIQTRRSVSGGRGGRREGAGRPSGSGWRPAVTELRAAAAEKLASVIGSASDPLSVVIDAACNEDLDIATRLGAASIALPYLYPRLSATQVSATVTTIKTDHGAVLDRLAERIERLVGPPRRHIAGRQRYEHRQGEATEAPECRMMRPNREHADRCSPSPHGWHA